MHSLILVCALLSTTPQPQAVDLADADRMARRVGEWIDFEAELGLRIAPELLNEFKWDRGLMKHDPNHIFQFRVRVGYLILHEPYYWSLGPTVSYGGLGEWSIGFQTVLTFVWGGYWIAAEPAWNFDRGLKFSLSAGWSIGGIEWQSTIKPAGHAILLKLRIPLGLITFVKTQF